MKKDTKIFITCLVVGMWSLNLGMVNFNRAMKASRDIIPSDISFDMNMGIGCMAIGILLFAFGNMNHGDY